MTLNCFSSTNRWYLLMKFITGRRFPNANAPPRWGSAPIATAIWRLSFRLMPKKMICNHLRLSYWFCRPNTITMRKNKLKKKKKILKVIMKMKENHHKSKVVKIQANLWKKTRNNYLPMLSIWRRKNSRRFLSILFNIINWLGRSAW